MKPVTTDKSGETASNYRCKKNYFAGKKSFMKKRANKAARRLSKQEKI